MFKIKEKLRARVNELEAYRYRNRTSLEKFFCLEDKSGEIGAASPRLPENSEELHVGDRWKGRDLYLWIQKDITIPADWKDETVVGLFDFGITGGGGNSGFESLVYINGNPYQGVDSNHKEVFFQKELSGETFELTFRLWSGLEGGGPRRDQEHTIHRAELAVLDTAVDDFYYTTYIMLETIDALGENDPDRTELLSLLNQAYLLLDWCVPGSAEFYASVYEANEYIQKKIDGFNKTSSITINCIGHTHIDVAWLWRLKHTREKAARSFSTVLRLMEKYPDYIFLQSQPQLYEYIKNDYPMIYEQIKERIKEGRWEADGAMWVEADCNISSGESLVRQILVGTNFMKDEFDKESEYLWLPDVFGYSWALPQILKKSGIDTFMTTKISWNQYNRIPHDTFHWRGIDGSEVLAHFITTSNRRDTNTFFSTYNGMIEPQTVTGIWDKYQDKNINQKLLLSYGHGDGGGGVNREMLEKRRRTDRMKGLPNVKTSTAAEYFRELQETVKNTDEYVHTWDGELYLEYHRGTYTSQAYNKKMNRKLELAYRKTEWLNVLGAVRNGDFSDYPAEKLLEGWKIILRNQFHDIIPGSSIREVYEDSEIEYAQAMEISNNGMEHALNHIMKDAENTWTVFNDSGWTHGETVLIEMSSDAEGIWYDSDNNALQAQRCDEGWRVHVPAIPALGWKSVTFSESEAADSMAFSYEDQQLTTPFYQIRWNEKGQIISIYDRDAEREVVAEGSKANVLQIFEDKPLAFDAWDIDIFYQEKMKEIDTLRSVRLVENGELMAVVRFEYEYHNSLIEQDMIVYKYSRRIDFKTKVDWHERQQLLKAAFPVDIRANEARYNIQYGNVKRPTHWNTSWDQARFESVGHQWADLAERNYGAALLNDCKYGYDIKDNVIRLSLLKSAINPDIEQDQGLHEFTYSLLPHMGDFIEGLVEQEAWYLNQPATVIKGSAGNEITCMFTFDNAAIEVDAVKRAEKSDGIILRLHEFSGARQKLSVGSPLGITKWQESNLMEKVDETWNSGDISLEFTPYEIKTLYITL